MNGIDRIEGYLTNWLTGWLMEFQPKINCFLSLKIILIDIFIRISNVMRWSCDVKEFHCIIRDHLWVWSKVYFSVLYVIWGFPFQGIVFVKVFNLWWVTLVGNRCHKVNIWSFDFVCLIFWNEYCNYLVFCIQILIKCHC